MKIRDYPILLEREFGTENVYLTGLINPLVNPILDEVVFVDKNGAPLIPTRAWGLNSIFCEPMAGPFYDLEFFGLILNYSSCSPIKFKKWKPFRVIAIDNTGEKIMSEIFNIKASVENLNNYAKKNNIKWSGHEDFYSYVEYFRKLRKNNSFPQEGNT